LREESAHAREQRVAPDERVGGSAEARRARGGTPPLDRRGEAIAPRAHGLDDLRLVGVVLERAADRGDRLRERGLADARAAPDRGDELVLRDHAPARARQVEEDVERLRPERHARAVLAELEELVVELEVAEHEGHASVLPQGGSIMIWPLARFDQ